MGRVHSALNHGSPNGVSANGSPAVDGANGSPTEVRGPGVTATTAGASTGTNTNLGQGSGVGVPTASVTGLGGATLSPLPPLRLSDSVFDTSPAGGGGVIRLAKPDAERNPAGRGRPGELDTTLGGLAADPALVPGALSVKDLSGAVGGDPLASGNGVDGEHNTDADPDAGGADSNARPSPNTSEPVATAGQDNPGTGGQRELTPEDLAKLFAPVVDVAASFLIPTAPTPKESQPVAKPADPPAATEPPKPPPASNPPVADPTPQPVATPPAAKSPVVLPPTKPLSQNREPIQPIQLGVLEDSGVDLEKPADAGLSLEEEPLEVRMFRDDEKGEDEDLDEKWDWDEETPSEGQLDPRDLARLLEDPDAPQSPPATRPAPASSPTPQPVAPATQPRPTVTVPARPAPVAAPTSPTRSAEPGGGEAPKKGGMVRLAGFAGRMIGKIPIIGSIARGVTGASKPKPQGQRVEVERGAEPDVDQGSEEVNGRELLDNEIDRLTSICSMAAVNGTDYSAEKAKLRRLVEQRKELDQIAGSGQRSDDRRSGGREKNGLQIIDDRMNEISSEYGTLAAKGKARTADENKRFDQLMEEFNRLRIDRATIAGYDKFARNDDDRGSRGDRRGGGGGGQKGRGDRRGGGGGGRGRGRNSGKRRDED